MLVAVARLEQLADRGRRRRRGLGRGRRLLRLFQFLLRFGQRLLRAFECFLRLSERFLGMRQLRGIGGTRRVFARVLRNQCLDRIGDNHLAHARQQMAFQQRWRTVFKRHLQRVSAVERLRARTGEHYPLAALELQNDVDTLNVVARDRRRLHGNVDCLAVRDRHDKGVTARCCLLFRIHLNPPAPT
ncbi:hypothetical protein [Pandoraea fibrosis]|uniref:hypothetical protein n=1 Tax=Pandoraea fibrosis TaxID=1891094 RepID=UPI00177B1FFC|nr:hypothetical protein [Pandoraea fibrosis]